VKSVAARRQVSVEGRRFGVQVCHVRREHSVAAKLGQVGSGFVDENIGATDPTGV
jgi:hypothetical protein